MKRSGLFIVAFALIFVLTDCTAKDEPVFAAEPSGGVIYLYGKATAWNPSSVKSWRFGRGIITSRAQESEILLPIQARRGRLQENWNMI